MGCGAVGGMASLFSVEGAGCYLGRSGNGQSTHWSPGARRVQGQLHRLTREGGRAMTKYEASCLSGMPLEKQEAGSAGRVVLLFSVLAVYQEEPLLSVALQY